MIQRNRKVFIAATAIFIIFSFLAVRFLLVKTSDVPNKCGLGAPDAVFVTASGTVMDKSFNQSSWEGLQDYCSSFSLGVDYIETLNRDEFVTNLQAASDQAPVVIVNAPLKSKEVYKLAVENPDTKYVIIWGEAVDANGAVMQLDNVKSYNFHEEQASYLVGYIAGKTTITNHVGYITGGLDDEVSVNYFSGYIQGLEASGRPIEVDIKLLEGYNDEEGAQAAAAKMYDEGCDVIFHSAGQSGIGVINEATMRKQNGDSIWVIGADNDQFEIGQYGNKFDKTSSVLTSAVIYNDKAVFDAMSEFFTGVWVGDNTYLGIDTNSVGLPVANPNVEQTLAEEAKFHLILDGNIDEDVRDNKAEYTNIVINKY